MKKHSTFEITISILMIINLIGCASLHPIEAEPDELQYKIRHENVVNIHDWVVVYTEDGKELQFQITAIDENYIHGDDVARDVEVSVPINSIVALKSQKVSIGKTSLLVGAGLGVSALIFLAIAPALILSAAAP